MTPMPSAFSEAFLNAGFNPTLIELTKFWLGYDSMSTNEGDASRPPTILNNNFRKRLRETLVISDDNKFLQA